ncbi:kinase-like domain-containing protein [Glomus cerebriforme]|uniref:Kinase-like domain-containing protein n=1 Tax=Glomus cerebriforme TaxID=658196 RepID=A0A397S8A1_9GLOM|nr:kinase-like domain-containing protein [Glomus cerebriforme]
MQLKINAHYNIVFEWIPYNQFNNIKEIGNGSFSIVYSAIWKDGPLRYKVNKYVYERNSNCNVALKCLHNSQNITYEFLNEIKSYSINDTINILQIYGISQNPDTKNYIMVTAYAEDGDCYSWLKKYCNKVDWKDKIHLLLHIIDGLQSIHQKQMVHHDLHLGNILMTNATYAMDVNYTSSTIYYGNIVCISDMGLCRESDNIDETKIYEVMPYVAPEVLRGKPYTQAADIYSFGMIMYFVATGRQPFDNHAHDQNLVLNICSGFGPEINEQEVPKCYIDLIKRCWDSNSDNRPNVIEVKESIDRFSENKKFSEVEEYRKANLLTNKNNQSITHSQAIYTSRLLNPFTKDLPKWDNNINNNSVEVIDFVELSVINEIAKQKNQEN